jgi:hypothetical protein
VIAYSRPFWPLFLHVLGAMTLFGAVLAVAIVSWVAWKHPLPVLARSAFWALLAVAVPAWIVMRVGGGWISSKEGYPSSGGPTWLKIGMGVGDGGLLFLLVSTGAAFWWQRAGNALGGRIVTVLTTVYLLLLGVAWFAMSAKWG